MPIYCDNCGHQNRDSVKFCQGCGGKIIATTTNGSIKPGVILNKNYEIKSLIKQGGMGAVYKAFNLKFNTDCAVKELLSHPTNPQNQQYFIESFEREAKILHKLRHPNIPVVVDYFIEAGRYYLVMDYIEGKDLDVAMSTYYRSIVPEATVIEWAKEILDALSYLHSQNPPVIYRDIKPANIMLRTSDQKIVLIDFGIARTVTPGGQTEKTRIGTSGYAPVEQCRGKAEPRSDLYALGATMHHLLTGVEPLPFKFEPLRKVNSSISMELEQIVMRALKDNLQERFSTAKEMKEAIVNLSSPVKFKVNTQIQQTKVNSHNKVSTLSSVNSNVKVKNNYIAFYRIIVAILFLPILVTACYLIFSRLRQASTEVYQSPTAEVLSTINGSSFVDTASSPLTPTPIAYPTATSVAISPSPTTTYIEHGEIALKDKKYEEANEWFKKAIKLNLSQEEKANLLNLKLNCNLKIGEMYLRKKSYDTGMKNYKEALHIDMNNKEAKEGLAKCFVGKGNVLLSDRKYKEARGYFSKKEIKEVESLYKEAKSKIADIDNILNPPTPVPIPTKEPVYVPIEEPPQPIPTKNYDSPTPVIF